MPCSVYTPRKEGADPYRAQELARLFEQCEWAVGTCEDLARDSHRNRYGSAVRSPRTRLGVAVGYKLLHTLSAVPIADASLAEIGDRIGRLRDDLDELMADTVCALRQLQETRATVIRDQAQRVTA